MKNRLDWGYDDHSHPETNTVEICKEGKPRKFNVKIDPSKGPALTFIEFSYNDLTDRWSVNFADKIEFILGDNNQFGGFS
jgi:hypothetical protein